MAIKWCLDKGFDGKPLLSSVCRTKYKYNYECHICYN